MRAGAPSIGCRTGVRQLIRTAYCHHSQIACWPVQRRCRSRCLLKVASTARPDDHDSSDLWAPAARDADQGAPVASDWRAFRAALVAQEAAGGALRRAAEADKKQGPGTSAHGAAEGWAHPIALPERGCLVLARQPDMGPDFSEAVIFLLDHDTQTGSAGFVLNMPMGLRLRDVGLQEEVAGGFRQQNLYRGGPVSDSTLYVLHGHCISDAFEIVDGVFTGGLAQANALVLAGQVAAQDFKLLAGYAGWGAGQLEAEVKAGSWWLVAAAPSVTLAAVRGTERLDGSGERRGMWEDVMRRAGLAGDDLRPFHDF